MAIEFVCKDDPAANGRTPHIGDQRYTLTFPLDDGSSLLVHMGKEGVTHFASFIAELMVDEHEEQRAKESTDASRE